MIMKSTLRCCISCILPCGSFDVIRIVHVNGHVEEISGTIYAAEIMKAHPKHILKKPTTKPTSDDIEPASTRPRPAIVVVPPDAQLQRGKIYFLIPVSDSSKNNARRRRKEQFTKQQNCRSHGNNHNNNNCSNNNNNVTSNNKDNDKYLSEILSEKILSNNRERRRGRVAVWRPHLESIYETLSDVASNDQ